MNRIEVELTDDQLAEVDAYITYRSSGYVDDLTRGQAVRELALRGLTYTRTASA